LERSYNLSGVATAAPALEGTLASAGDAVALGLGQGATEGTLAAGERVFAFDDDAGCDLSVTGVTKRFGPITALDDVSLKVASGEFVTILGPSGCGKTTLLRIIAGLELADCGTLILGGSDITRVPANKRPVNTVFQNYALFPHLNVFENIAFGLRARRFPQRTVDTRVNAALEMLHLEEMPRRRPSQLSGGQKQRVALARALVNQPDILLLDEPMSALDAKLRAEVQLELRRLQRQLGKTFILVTHDQNEAMTVSDRIFVMRDARIVQHGPPAEVYDRPANRFVAEFLGTTNLIPAWRTNGSVHTELGNLVPRVHPAWEKGFLSIRPEKIVVRSAKPSANGIRAIISEVIYRGDHLDVYVQPGNLHLRGMPGASLTPGQQIWLELPSRQLEAIGE
jgi:spermidine/putrescine transport system ATP-binding protein